LIGEGKGQYIGIILTYKKSELAADERRLTQIKENKEVKEKDICVNQRLSAAPILMVGFNRRFAPLARKMKALIGMGTVNIVATMNAGEIPANSWVHDLAVGGGRIVGEACHFIDL
jgi:hypothetical protein